MIVNGTRVKKEGANPIFGAKKAITFGVIPMIPIFMKDVIVANTKPSIDSGHNLMI